MSDRVGQVWERGRQGEYDHGIFVVVSLASADEGSWRMLWLAGELEGALDVVGERLFRSGSWRMLDSGSLPSSLVR